MQRLAQGEAPAAAAVARHLWLHVLPSRARACTHAPQPACFRAAPTHPPPLPFLSHAFAGTRERQYEALIRRTCEAIIVAALHPRALIQVVVQVVSDDGSLLACAMNAACAALVDAAVPLRTLFAAVSAAQLAEGSGGGEGGSGGVLLLDPSAGEEAAAVAVGTFAYLPLVDGSGEAAGNASSSSTGSGSGDRGGQLQLLTSLTRGRLTSDQLLDMVEGGKQGADRLAAFMQHTARG